MLLRQATAITALPVTVAIAVPWFIARSSDLAFVWPSDAFDLVIASMGMVSVGVGLMLFGMSVFHFWRHGRGTLAPWDPPRRFVVEGPYRFVRNPMISGVFLVVLGQACILRARPLAVWAAVFALINAVYIPLLEEPMLVARFGEAYTKYLRSVPRFIPRLRPWTPAR